MENIIYRINMENATDLEFFVCGTNEVEPYRRTKEVGIQLILGDKQLDASLELDDLDSLIKYLEDCKSYITKFNNNSPIIDIK